MDIFRDYRPTNDASAVTDPTDANTGEWINRLAEENEFLLSLTRGLETAFGAAGDGLVRPSQKSLSRNVTEMHITLIQNFEELAASERSIRTLIANIFASNEKHRKVVSLRPEGRRKHLGAINEMLNNSGTAASNLSGLKRAVKVHLNEILVAQHCERSARQKIGRVRDALGEIRAQVFDGKNSASARDADARDFISQAGKMEVEQCRILFEGLHQAGGSLVTGMQGLEKEAAAATDLAVDAGRATLQAKAASNCKISFDRVLSAIDQAYASAAISQASPSSKGPRLWAMDGSHS